MTLFSAAAAQATDDPDRDDRERYPSFIPARRIAESTRHHVSAGDVFYMLKHRYRDAPDVLVAGNLYLYYREGDPQSMVSPDVFVAFGVPSGPRHTYKLWAEAAGPAVVFELLSESTRSKDLGRNKVLYAQLGVAEYFIYDPEGDFLTEVPPIVWTMGEPQYQLLASGVSLPQYSTPMEAIRMDSDGATAAPLDPGDILIAEFNYITQTAFQANEDRARVSSYYLVSVAAVIGAVFGAKLDGTSVLLVNLAFGVLFAILSFVGATTLLQLARLRAAWDEAAVAMNMIKCYYATHATGDPLEAALFWKTSTLRWERNHRSVSFLLAISVIVISSAMAVIAVGYWVTALFQGVTTVVGWDPPASWETGRAVVWLIGTACVVLVGLVLAGLLGWFEYRLYWSWIDSERSDRKRRLKDHFVDLRGAGAGTVEGDLVEALERCMKLPKS